MKTLRNLGAAVAVIALLATAPTVAEIPTMRGDAWLGMSPEARTAYVAALWDGFQEFMGIAQAAQIAACIDSRHLTAAQLAADMTKVVSSDPAPGALYIRGLLLKQLLDICKPLPKGGR
jgi:hypothetical protein